MNLQAPKCKMDEHAAIALLEYMDRTQLQEFLDNPDKIDTHIADLEQTKVTQKDRENLIVKNKSLAEYNISLQPHFDSLKQQVATAYEEVNALKVALCQDVAKLEAAPGCQSHDTLLAIFQTEAAFADEKSEEIAEDFCDKKIDIDTFLSEYIPRRSEAYMKKAKIEKAGELFRQFSSTDPLSYSATSTSQNSYVSPQTSTSPGYMGAGYGVGSAPYPAPGLGRGMPMPSYYQR